jgi:predicted alpha/beta hydrolase
LAAKTCPSAFTVNGVDGAGSPTIFFDDPLTQSALVHFPEVRTPIMAATSIDDPWIPPVSRDFFFEGYRNTSVTPIDLNPADFGFQSLGHMGYFRKNAQRLWDAALDWFDEAVVG